jgi:hypothetical protein
MISVDSPDGKQEANRRQFLRIGGFGALSLFWGDWLRAAVTGRTHGLAKAKSVILIFNCGAPSHIDLWDMKPDAPDTIRGEFRPIATNVPGVRISELMPRLARHADKYAIVRTVHHRHGGHNSGMYWSIVGRPYPMDSTLINPSRTDYPSFGTLVGWLAQRDGYSSAVPPYVITPAPHCDSTVYITPGQFGSCLGARYDPLVLNSDPNAPNFRVSNISLASDMTAPRLQERRSLLRRLDGPASESSAFAVNQAKAMSLVTSPEVQKAFDLSQEPARLRERYGRHSWGQSHLLARRLVEAGVRFVTTVNGQSIIWDTHKDNFSRLKNRLVPPMEQGFAALLEDLDARGRHARRNAHCDGGRIWPHAPTRRQCGHSQLRTGWPRSLGGRFLCLVCRRGRAGWSGDRQFRSNRRLSCVQSLLSLQPGSNDLPCSGRRSADCNCGSLEPANASERG